MKDNAVEVKSKAFAIYLTDSQFKSLYNDSNELLRILTSIIKTAKTP